MTWELQLICCGRDDGSEKFDTWETADAFRNSYTSGPGIAGDGHDRAAVLKVAAESHRQPETTVNTEMRP